MDESHKEENKVEANNTGSGEKKMPSEVVRKDYWTGKNFDKESRLLLCLKQEAFGEI